MKRIHAVAAGLAAAALTVAGLVNAQPCGTGAGAGPGFGPGMGMHWGPGMGMHGGPGMGMYGGPGMGMYGWHGPMGAFDPAATIDARLADFKAQLKVTAAQEGAWQTFADAAKKNASSMQAMHQQMLQSSGTAPERLAQHSQLMQQRVAGMTTAANAFNALYAVLTPEQKAVADQHFGPIAHRGPGFARRTG